MNCEGRWSESRTLCKNMWLSAVMGRWTFCYIWFQLIAAHIDFMKEKKIATFQGKEWVKPVGLCGHGMWLGNPDTGGGSARCKGMFEGHSMASLESQMGKNPSDRELPSHL